jgi:hypothetical protein
MCIVIDGSDIAVKAWLEFLIVPSADRGGYKNAVSPDNWAGKPKARNRSFPADILGPFDIPSDRRRISIRNTVCIRSSIGKY